MNQEKSKIANRQLSIVLTVSALIILTIVLSILTYMERSYLATFSIGSLTLTHWAAYIGGFWIALFTPIYYAIKHHSPKHLKSMLKIHVFGNLVAFALITIHYTYQESIASFLGTGTALYVAVLALIITGIFKDSIS